MTAEINRLNNAITKLYKTLADVGGYSALVTGALDATARYRQGDQRLLPDLIAQRSDSVMPWHWTRDSVARMRLRLGQGSSLTDAQSAEWDKAFGMSGGAPTQVTVKPEQARVPAPGRHR